MACERVRYTTVAIALHWLIALLVLAGLGLGLYGSELESDAGELLVDLHKLGGLLVLLLTFARLAWRIGHRPPPLPRSVSGLERLLAALVHALFYVLLFLLPLSGWLLTSAFPGRHPIVVGDLATIPFLPVSPDMALAQSAFTVHEVSAWTMLALVALHVIGAMKHHFIDRDAVLSRIHPFSKAETIA